PKKALGKPVNRGKPRFTKSVLPRVLVAGWEAGSRSQWPIRRCPSASSSGDFRLILIWPDSHPRVLLICAVRGSGSLLKVAKNWQSHILLQWELLIKPLILLAHPSGVEPETF